MASPRTQRIARFTLIALGFWGLECDARAIAAAKTANKSAKAPAKTPAKPLTYETALHGSNYLASKRMLQDVVRANRPKEAAAAAEWTRSLLALVSLERLIGDEAEARKQFARCDSLCTEQTSAEEWQSIKDWACNGTKTPIAACKLRKK